MTKAVEEYNNIMYKLGYEHNTIGTRFSEDTEDWNLRDMLAECDYVLDTYSESGHANYEMLHGSDGKDGIEQAEKEIAELKKFLKKYDKEGTKLNTMACRHCSKYDIRRR